MTPDLFLAAAPPPGAQHLASDDPDEVTSWVSRRDGHHSRVVHGTGPYGFRLALIESPGVQVAWASARLANTLRGFFGVPTFHVPLAGVQRYAYGRRRLQAASGQLMFLPSGTDVTRHSEGDLLMAVEFGMSTFESEVQGRHGNDRVEWSTVPRTVDLAESQMRQLIEAVDAMVRAQVADVPASGRRHAESRVLSALAGTLTWPTRGRVAPVANERLRRLEDWIDAHVTDAITLGRLCEVAQVGERSLQVAFQARRGMSPMCFVRERRLAAAQRRLFRSRPDEDVTAIATSLGFIHLGRFSSAYFATFGESPSRTLARGRRWSRARSVAASMRPDDGNTRTP